MKEGKGGGKRKGWEGKEGERREGGEKGMVGNLVSS